MPTVGRSFSYRHAQRLGTHAKGKEIFLEQLDKLEITQWWNPEKLLQHQMRQAAALVEHAYRTTPFYRQRFDAAGYRPGIPLTPDRFAELPISTRADIQAAGESAFSRQVPRQHGHILVGETTGSTGRPLVYRGTRLAEFLWNVLTLREHLWHQRDFEATAAIVRAGTTNQVRPSWGHPTDKVFRTGACVTLDIRTDIAHQVDWLQENKPAYFLTHPSNLRAIAGHCLKHRITLDGLRQLRCVGEIVDSSLRQICRAAFDVPLVDMYSACETGYIALQCPESNYYHAQSETVLVEVLDENYQPCQVGEMGRVIITVLHNFAMPFIRYEIGDYAVVGSPCTCGRGLPAFERIVGRKRNLVVLPDGRRYWPLVGYKTWMDIAPIRQAQFFQKDRQTVEARLVTPRPLTPDEQSGFIGALQFALGFPFRIEISYHSMLSPSPGGKFEDFISLVE